MILSPTKNTWALLSLLRFLLATIVFLGHLWVIVELPIELEFIKNFGPKAAVLGFLFISGLSIGYSYKRNAKGYFYRRFLRVYPLYFGAVVFTLLIQILLDHPIETFRRTFYPSGILTSFANIFFLQGWVAISMPYNGPLWSLSIEVFFYALVPFLSRLSSKILILLVATSLGVFTFFSIGQYIYGWLALLFAWSWLIGFLFITRKPNFLGFLFLLLGVLAAWLNKRIMPEYWSWLTFLATILLVWISFQNLRISKTLQKVFNYLGELSYPLYVFHMPLFILLYYLGIREAYSLLLLLFIVIIPINYFVDHWLKKIFWIPFLNFLKLYALRLRSNYNDNISKRLKGDE